MEKLYWLTQTSQDVPDSIDWLHPSEKMVFSKFRFNKRKEDWLLGRWTAKNTVSYCLKKEFPQLVLQDLAIIAATDGAPEVYYRGNPSEICISLSHSHGNGFCVAFLPGNKVGCDLEKIEPRSVTFIGDYFTPKEQVIILDSDDWWEPLYANLIWSAKESAMKALRLGLSIDTRNVNIEFSHGSENLKWYKLKASMVESEDTFQGYWHFSPEFVFTILGDMVDFKPVEIVIK